MLVNFFLYIDFTLKREDFIKLMTPTFEVSNLAHLDPHLVERICDSDLDLLKLLLVLCSLMTKTPVSQLHLFFQVLHIEHLIIKSCIDLLSELTSYLIDFMTA